MRQSNQQPPYLSILFLILIGAAAMLLAFWFLDHRLGVPNSVVVIVALIGVFFVSCTWAFLRFLQWRGKNRVVTVSVPLQPRQDLEGTVYRLIPGHEYGVIKPFTDHYGNVFEQGQRLRFKQRHFLPYHGGHTIVFEERPLYLQEDQNREILDHFSDYIAPIQS